MRMISKLKIQDIKGQLTNKIYTQHMYMPYQMQGAPISDELKHCIEGYVRNVVSVAMDELLNQIYTQEDFEDDIGISS